MWKEIVSPKIRSASLRKTKARTGATCYAAANNYRLYLMGTFSKTRPGTVYRSKGKSAPTADLIMRLLNVSLSRVRMRQARGRRSHYGLRVENRRVRLTSPYMWTLCITSTTKRCRHARVSRIAPTTTEKEFKRRAPTTHWTRLSMMPEAERHHLQVMSERQLPPKCPRHGLIVLSFSLVSRVYYRYGVFSSGSGA